MSIGFCLIGPCGKGWSAGNPASMRFFWADFFTASAILARASGDIGLRMPVEVFLAMIFKYTYVVRVIKM
jgi:hypothetical protein